MHFCERKLQDEYFSQENILIFFFLNLLNINHKQTFGTKDSLVNDSVPWFFQ